MLRISPYILHGDISIKKIQPSTIGIYDKRYHFVIHNTSMIYDSTIYQTWLYRVIMEQMTISEKFLPHIQWQYHGILYVTNSDI